MKIKNYIYSLIGVLILLPCLSVPISGNVTYLDQVFENAAFEEDSISLVQGAIEIKLHKDLSGQMAVIYDKTFDETAITAMVHDYYVLDQAAVTQDLSKAYDKVYKNLNAKLAKLSIETPHVREGMNQLKALQATLRQGPLSTIDLEIQQAVGISAMLDAGFDMDFVGLSEKDKEIAITIERIRNLDLQKIIDGLNETRLSYEAKARQDLEEALVESVAKAYKSIDQKTILFDGVGNNEKEFFVKVKFKDIRLLDQAFTLGKAKDYMHLESVSTIFSLYETHEQEAPEIKAARDLVEEMKVRSQQLMTIRLEQDGLNLLTKEMNTLTDLIKGSEGTGTEIIDQISATRLVMVKYRDKGDKIKEDADQVEKVLDLLDTFKASVKSYQEAMPSHTKLVESFGDLWLLAYDREKALPVGIRISLEGDFLLRKQANGTVTTGDNYFVNMASSGDSAMRLVSGEDHFMAFFKPDAVSLKTIGYSLLAYLGLLVGLFILRRNWFKNLMVANVLILLCFVVIYPLVWVVGASFNESSSLGSVGISPFPKDFSLIQYERLLLTTDYKKWFLNTFKIAVSNMTITVSLAVSAAYVFSRFKFKGKKVGLMTMLIIQIFPSFSALVAIYTLLANVRFLSFLTGQESLVNTHLGLILVYCAGQIPYNTWLIKGYFDTLPRSMDEAARIDGASNMQAFIRVILPLGRPIIAFVAVTSFMAPWMDFILPRLLLKSTEKKTLAVGLFEMINGNSNNNFTMFAAGAVLVAVPITLMYAYFQKYIVKGLASGAVKG